MKIFIIAPDNIDSLEIANNIIALNDNLNICETFTTAKNDISVSKYTYVLDIEEILLAFKNNVLLFIDYNDENVCGITLDNYDSSDIIIITPKHFNAIPDIYLADKETLVVLLDHKMEMPKIERNIEIIESGYVQDRINEMEIPLMFFVDETAQIIAKIIIEYINGDNEKRNELILENS